MSDPTNRRKVEHIDIISSDSDVDRRKFYFDDILLRHRALPEINYTDVDSSTKILGKQLSFPLLISSMTGGDHEELRTINRNLAQAAEACGIAFAVGSQRVMFTHPGAAESFQVREAAPNTLVFANLGAVQLNYGFGIDEARKAVEVTGANALFLHLNPLQEAIQPEGDTNFSGLAARIGALAAELEVPVVIKEIGSGLSLEDVTLLAEQGIRYFDVAGSGGTSWSRIEHHRDTDDNPGLLFQDWGIPTPAALQELEPLAGQVIVFASGGIRSGLDMAKAMVMGSALCGMAKPFLGPARESADAVCKVIKRIEREFKTAMFLTGQNSVEQLRGKTALLL